VVVAAASRAGNLNPLGDPRGGALLSHKRCTDLKWGKGAAVTRNRNGSEYSGGLEAVKASRADRRASACGRPAPDQVPASRSASRLVNAERGST
jgi:hypothetical protein